MEWLTAVLVLLAVLVGWRLAAPAPHLARVPVRVRRSPR